MKCIIGLFLLLLASPTLFAQTAVVEVDHVFVFVSPGGEQGAAAFRKLGFAVDSATFKHVGQGTASRSVLFGNAYFEMIWVDSTVAVSNELRESAAGLQRAAAWRSAGVSPFGLGLRKLAGPDEYGLPVTRYTADWMEGGSAVLLLRQTAEPSAFDVFVVPSYMSVPAWIGDVERQALQLLEHPNGARRISRIEMHGPLAHHAQASRALSIPGFSAEAAPDALLVLELDNRSTGAVHDLRPLMPVLIRR